MLLNGQMNKDKIRVLHCIESIASGGVEQRRLLLANRLNKEGFEQKIVCTKSTGPIAEALRNVGLDIFEVGPFRSPWEFSKYRKLIHIIRQYRPHIIHGAVFEGMSMATVGGVLGRVPIILLEETSDPKYRSKKAIFLQRIYANYAHYVIGVSPYVVAFLRDKAKIDGRKVVLINNGVAIPQPSNEASDLKLRKQLGLISTDFIIGSVGRVIDDVKGFSDILKALYLLKNPDIKFLLVGDGPDLGKLVGLARSKGLSNQFIYVGYQADPGPFYTMMDVCCLPSYSEGFGLVAVESMLHHLPVIASETGGLQNIVVDGKTGLIVPPRRPDLLSTKIEVLRKHPQRRYYMGEMGYRRALAHYTADRYCRDVTNLYLKSLKEKFL